MNNVDPTSITMYESRTPKYKGFSCKKIFTTFAPKMLVVDLTSPVRHNYCIDTYIPVIYRSTETVDHVQVDVLSKNHQACHIGANGIKPENNSTMTDKHNAEY